MIANAYLEQAENHMAYQFIAVYLLQTDLARG